MEQVAPNYNLSRWIEANPYPIAPADIYKIIKANKGRDGVSPENFSTIVNDIYNELFADHEIITLDHIACVMVGFLVRDTFDGLRVGMICRTTAKALTDIIETPRDQNSVGEILYFPYTVRSGEDTDWIYKTYGDRVVLIDEMRDSAGYLKQYRVVLKEKTV